MFFKKKNIEKVPNLYGDLFPNCSKTKENTPVATALKNLFEGKAHGEIINDTIYIYYEMNADDGLAILGATAMYDFSANHMDKYDDETKFWISACTLRFVKNGYSEGLDKARNLAEEFFNSYPDEMAKIKVLLLL